MPSPFNRSPDRSRTLATLALGLVAMAGAASPAFATVNQTYPTSMCAPILFSGWNYDDQGLDRPNYLRLDYGTQEINHNSYNAWYYVTCPIVRQDDANGSGTVTAEMSFHSPNNGDFFFCDFYSFDQYGNQLDDVAGGYSTNNVWDTMQFSTTNISPYGYFNLLCGDGTGDAKRYSYRFSEP